VHAAGEHHVGPAVADQVDRLADGLGAGRAGGQARQVRPPRAEGGRDVSGRRPRLLLGLDQRIEQLRTDRREATGVNAAAVERTADQVDEPRKIPGPVPRAKVNAEPRWAWTLAIEQARLPHSLGRGGQRQPRVPGVSFPPGRVGAEVSRQVEPLDLSGDPRGEVLCVEQRHRPDSAAPLAQ
jgi:hypothetical protein